MPDYEKMYHEMVREAEKAIDILVAAQRKCEEMYISAPPPQLTVLSSEERPPETPDRSAEKTTESKA